MQFDSLYYFIYLIIVSLVYFFIPHRFRNGWLLVVSYFFYMCWNYKYALLMFSSTVITFVSGILISRLQNSSRNKKIVVALSLISNLSILFFFKYYNFAAYSVNFVFDKMNILVNMPELNVLLPVGISFYTFQALGYTIDVYRGEKAEKNFFTYALFVSFFPQLVAGPIERSKNLLGQFKKIHVFDYLQAREGFLMILWGLFKKIVISNRIAVVANSVYNDVYEYSGVIYVIATVAFAVQIYCDFSAYTDIALGSAKVLGFRLMKNFDTPYFSKSVKEFWRRWHISLSGWFRDYLYFPLGGSRVSTGKKYFNIMVVFLVSGLWHGAGVGFVVWGFLNGFFQVIGDITANVRNNIIKILKINAESYAYKVFRTLMTFGLICVTWVFFRANTFDNAVYIVTHMAYPNYWALTDGTLLKLGLDIGEWVVMIASLLILYWFDKESRNKNIFERIENQHLFFRWGTYWFLLFFVLVFGYYGQGYSSQQFIYFQF